MVLSKVQDLEYGALEHASKYLIGEDEGELRHIYLAALGLADGDPIIHVRCTREVYEHFLEWHTYSIKDVDEYDNPSGTDYSDQLIASLKNENKSHVLDALKRWYDIFEDGTHENAADTDFYNLPGVQVNQGNAAMQQQSYLQWAESRGLAATASSGGQGPEGMPPGEKIPSQFQADPSKVFAGPTQDQSDWCETHPLVLFRVAR